MSTPGCGNWWRMTGNCAERMQQTGFKEESARETRRELVWMWCQVTRPRRSLQERVWNTAQPSRPPSWCAGSERLVINQRHYTTTDAILHCFLLTRLSQMLKPNKQVRDEISPTINPPTSDYYTPSSVGYITMILTSNAVDSNVDFEVIRAKINRRVAWAIHCQCIPDVSRRQLKPCSHNPLAVNKTILKPRLAAPTGGQYVYAGFSRRNKIPRCSAYDIGESNPIPASGL